jgi:mRNA interferase RelE/StbE
VSYAVSIRRSTQKELQTIPSPFYEKIEDQLLSLRDTPRPAGCKILKGTEKSWRIRVGNYRVIYEIDDAVKRITVIKIGHRSDVYR